MTELDLNADIIQVSDITERVEELDDELDSLKQDVEDLTEEATEAEGEEDYDAAIEARDKAEKALRAWTEEWGEELAKLKALLEELCGYGGDHQWNGDWYPQMLIDKEYFVDYAEQLVKDIGDVADNVPSYVVIDWKATADNLLADYSEVEIEGRTYYYR